MESIQKIKSLAHQFSSEFIEVRRKIHAHPELGFEEYKTAELIAAKLSEIGISYQTGIAKTGIVAMIEGRNPAKKTIALRADMDALPIDEKNNCEYQSVNKGVMHACGHDAHMACLLGAAKILFTLKDEFEGSIKLIFQPSEEKFPGGAQAMIKEGVLQNPVPQFILGEHVLPTLESGKIGLRGGKYMASTDEIYLTVKGKGGHAATPELNINPLLIASHILIALQEIAVNNPHADLPTVLSFGKIAGNGRTNIIPDVVTIDGTLRTFNEDWRAEAHHKITEIAQSIAQNMGGSCEVFIDKGYPFLVNDIKLTENIKSLAIEYLGRENVVDLEMRLTAEDFAYYSQEIPACFYRLGVRNEAKGITSNLHTNTFDIDENAIETGMGLMAWLACKQ
ncbi:MAG: M20 family metallopeptidase [Bacteroidetes bacterium]|nr:M20 family metallopeptidase [Bacteroidota bacterium]